jgi:glutathione synthase/RimK-type ligase-like ATP-grasp enzyme
MFRSNPIIDRFINFFSLPNCYREIIKLKECKKSRFAIAIDLLELFFSYKTFPDHYGPCRLWEVDKSNWKYYFGSNYQSYQKAKLLKMVQPDKYLILFNDKAVCELLCKGIGVDQPHTYGIISPDQNYREKIHSWFCDSSIDKLIIKPLSESGGKNIVVAKKVNNNIIIHSKTLQIPLQDFILSTTAIVQEVLKQDHRMATFSSSSVNTVRIMTMFTKDDMIIVLGATMRCAVGESYVDNWTAGGVAVGVDVETGRLKKYAYDKKGNRYETHPTSKVVFEDFVIAKWQDIINIAVKIQKAFPWYRILGMDIALQESGSPVLIEVNNNPDTLFQEQTSGPLFQREPILRAFGQYDLFVNRHQKQLYLSIENTSSIH